MGGVIVMAMGGVIVMAMGGVIVMAMGGVIVMAMGGGRGVSMVVLVVRLVSRRVMGIGVVPVIVVPVIVVPVIVGPVIVVRGGRSMVVVRRCVCVVGGVGGVAVIVMAVGSGGDMIVGRMRGRRMVIVTVVIVAVIIVAVGIGRRGGMAVIAIAIALAVAVGVMAMSLRRRLGGVTVMAVARIVAMIRRGVVVRLVLVAHRDSVPQPLSAVFAAKSV
jgi:hypothetical protein